ncbi:unnamed protein product [Diamesa serratosioi]
MLKWTIKKRMEDQQIYQFNGNQNDNLYNNKSIRRSLGNVLSERSPNVMSPMISDNKYHKRRSLGNQLVSKPMRFDKENEITSTPMRTQCSSLIKPKSFKRKLDTPGSASIINQIYEDPLPIYAPTLPSFDIEYSPVMKQPRYLSTNIEQTPIRKQKGNHLDFSYEFKPEVSSASSPLSTPLTTRHTNLGAHLLLNHSTSSASLNSSDVGDVTLEKMIDAILASAKNGKKFKKTIKTKPINNNFMKTLNEVCEQSMEQKNIKLSNNDQTIIIIDNKLDNLNEREVKSPNNSFGEEVELEEKCLLKRQKGVRRKNNSNENKLKKQSDETEKIDRDIQSCSTQKCLSFSSVNDADLSEKSKRSSVASTSSTSMNSLTSVSKYSKNLLVKGSIEMTISTDESQKKIIVHVIECKNLFRTSESHKVNAYVKCALVSANPLPIQRNIFQRTAVHKNSTSPVFDHKFSFDINDTGDCSKIIQLAVWHRNKELK